MPGFDRGLFGFFYSGNTCSATGIIARSRSVPWSKRHPTEDARDPRSRKGDRPRYPRTRVTMRIPKCRPARMKRRQYYESLARYQYVSGAMPDLSPERMKQARRYRASAILSLRGRKISRTSSTRPSPTSILSDDRGAREPTARPKDSAPVQE